MAMKVRPRLSFMASYLTTTRTLRFHPGAHAHPPHLSPHTFFVPSGQPTISPTRLFDSVSGASRRKRK